MRCDPDCVGIPAATIWAPQEAFAVASIGTDSAEQIGVVHSGAASLEALVGAAVRNPLHEPIGALVPLRPLAESRTIVFAGIAGIPVFDRIQPRYPVTEAP